MTMKVVWKCAMTMTGEQCVMTHGEIQMLLLCAGNLDSLPLVYDSRENWTKVVWARTMARDRAVARDLY